MLTRVRQEPDGAPPLDQIFSILQQEYRAANIDDIVSRLLKAPAGANVDQHRVILRLSRNAARQAQIVTTNFDLLFERAQKGLKRHVAPALPDLSSGQPLTGLVYLHGRLNPRTAQGPERHSLILSSSDFGRAYLADGWATRFVRDLLKNYVIVLLGYSASDPPVRYLLEGLHSRGDGNSARIYAFDQGTEAEVLSRWRNRGVIPLSYPLSDSMHSSLWDSLRAWASRADDPEKWRRSIIALALNDPKTLAAYERGQVASLVRATDGAKLFANAAEAPPAEWICVFDKHVRYGEPKGSKKEEEIIDPLALYGLDDDPPRLKKEEQNFGSSAIDVLSTSPFDEPRREYSRLAGVSGNAANPISPRLFYISRWFGRTLDDPAALWWAAGYDSLHPGLKDQIEWYLDHSNIEFSAAARRLWELLLQKFLDKPGRANHQYQIIAKIKRRGWSHQTQHEFEAAIQPFLTSRRPFQIGPVPPKGRCEELGAGQIVHFEVKFPGRGSKDLKVPPEQLYRYFRSVRRGLERAETLLESLETGFWPTASFETDSRPGERHLRDSDVYLHWAKNLFEQLSLQSPVLALADFRLWPNENGYFFDKLKIYFWNNASLFSGHEVADGLLALHEEGFWNGYHRRELLHTLKSRWNDMPIEFRKRIEERIIGGQTIDQHQNSEDARKRNASTAASLLGWLQHNGCALSDDAISRLSDARASDPNWNPRWESNADQSLDARAGYIAVKTDASKIVDLPISEIIGAAGQQSIRPFMEFTEHRPFSGLVKQRPRRALAALAYQARRGVFPLNFWQTALEDWPIDLPERDQGLFAARLARLPTNIISQLPHYAPRWLKSHLPKLALKSRSRALAVWDRLFNALISLDGKAIESGIGDVFVGGKAQDRSRRTYEHAINGPIGVMTETLFQILDDRKLGAKKGLSEDIRERLERLLVAPGEGADHAICEATIRLNWLFHLDPTWVAHRLIPMFSKDSDQAEPAWNGFLHGNSMGEPELFALLKPHFLGVFELVATWRWDDQAADRLHEFLVIGCYWNRKSGRYVSYTEARLALQHSTDEGRSHAIWMLASIISDQRAWKSFGKPFILNAWPKEARYQTEASSRQFAAIAEGAGDNFPDVVRSLEGLLVPSGQLDLIIYKPNVGGDDEDGAPRLPRKFPNAMLALLDQLVPDEPGLAPYELGFLVEAIAEANAGLRQDSRWRRLNRIVQAR